MFINSNGNRTNIVASLSLRIKNLQFLTKPDQFSIFIINSDSLFTEIQYPLLHFMSKSNLTHKVSAKSFAGDGADHFDFLPDSILILIFNQISDVKALGRCSLVSKRFHYLVPQVDNIFVRVDCVISNDGSVNSASSATSGLKSHTPFSCMLNLVFGGIVKPLRSLTRVLQFKRSASKNNYDDLDQGGVTHHSPAQVLKNFSEIKVLRIELPNGELGIDNGVLLKWRAEFGSTLDNCVILGASSVMASKVLDNNGVSSSGCDDNGSIPESFYTNGGLKLRVVWTISSLVSASARHYLLQQIIREHKTLDSLVLTDEDGQGVLCMNREQLGELRIKPLSASSASKRTLVPALNMRLWYAPQLELPNGSVLIGATLVAVRPSDQIIGKKEVADRLWVSSAFEEPYRTAAKMLIKRRTYCLEMNSF